MNDKEKEWNLSSHLKTRPPAAAANSGSTGMPVDNVNISLKEDNFGVNSFITENITITIFHFPKLVVLVLLRFKKFNLITANVSMRNCICQARNYTQRKRENY